MTGPDSVDRKRPGILRHNGRIPLLERAEKVGLSATPCGRRVNRMKEDIIVG